MKNKSILLAFCLAISLLLPVWSVRALVEDPFGGIVSTSIRCTCSAGNRWIWFTPLYLGGPIVVAGPLIYSPNSTTLYANLNIAVPGKWHMGDFHPGRACWIFVGRFCLPLPALGIMDKVGTN